MMNTLRLFDLSPNIGFDMKTTVPQSGLGADQDGARVSNLGDVNKDGIDDIAFLISRRNADTFSVGTVYVIYGQLGATHNDINIDNINQNSGFTISLRQNYTWLGSNVSSAGDINNDGIPDIIIGLSGGTSQFGQPIPAAYVIYGRSGPSQNIILEDMLPAQGFRIISSIQQFTDYTAGRSSPGNADVNGDGIDDLLLGFPGNPGQQDPSFGRVYVVYGRDAAIREDLLLKDFSKDDGFIILGEDVTNLTGHSVSIAGDINGDKIADILVGSPRGDLGGNDAGQAYVVFGQASSRTSIDLAKLSSGDGFKIIGENGVLNASARIGTSVSSAGDVNGDGLDDIIIGSQQSRPGNFFGSGEAYIIFGQTIQGRKNVDLKSLDKNDGFVLFSGLPSAFFGATVSSAGDVNGDGFDDIIVGAPNSNLGGDYGDGLAYVIFGRPTNKWVDFDFSQFSINDGLIILGDQNFRRAGANVSAAGDYNGDGLSDILVGSASNAHLIYGRSAFGVVPNAPPTAKQDAADIYHYSTTRSVVIDVLSNDSDVNNDPLKLVSIIQPANGSAVIKDGAFIEYAPKSGFVGIDRFSYVISDGKGGQAVGSVVVEVLADPVNILVDGFELISGISGSQNRINIVFLADGYIKDQLKTLFIEDINEAMAYLFRAGILSEPFNKYKEFFNIYAVFTPSAEVGADDTLSSERFQTALDGGFGTLGRDLIAGSSYVAAALNKAFLGTGIIPHISLVAVNTDKTGGTGGDYPVYAAGDKYSIEIALHEIAHSFIQLVDEYGSFGAYDPFASPIFNGPEPKAVNITTDRSGAKWSHWLGYNQPGIGIIGAYEGGLYKEFGIFRPSEESKMRALDRPFDAIAREQFILKFYEIVNLIDFHTGVGSLDNPNSLNVQVIDTEVIKIRWVVNDVIVSDGDVQSFVFSKFGIPSGIHRISALAYDPTDWVRLEDRSALKQNVNWTVTLSRATLFASGSVPLVGGVFQDDMFGDESGNYLSGMDGNDYLTGGGGNDTIDGGNGANDTAIFTGARQSYEVSRSGGTVAVRDLRSTGDGTDTLTGIERLQFTDGVMGLVAERLVVLQPSTRDLLSWDSTLGSNGFTYLVRLGSDTNVAAVADLTGDGRADLLLQQQGGGLTRWDISLGSNGFAPLTAAPGFTVVGTGDLVGSSASDILMRNTAGQLRVLDPATNAISDLLTIAEGWSLKGVANINGLGKADLIFQNDNSGVVIALTDQGWRDLITLTPNSGWQIAGLGDVVGGLADDFVFRNSATGVTIFWDATQGRQGFRDFATIAQGWNLLTISDLNGDGRDDVAYQNVNGAAIYWSGSNWVDLGSTLTGAQLQGTGQFA